MSWPPLLTTDNGVWRRPCGDALETGSLDEKVCASRPFNSADQQTCSYLCDDLARVSSANCGSIWTQTFSPDVFGNLTYTGNNGNFQPGYSSNQITLSGFSYDLDGNLLTTGTGTGSNTYTWNGFGEMTSDTPSGGSTVGINYDALGRPAMTNVNGGSYTEFVYGPDGSKLALMNGQTLSKARVGLPGGGTAVYDPTGLIRYWHSDWEGSIRLLSNPNQTYYSGAAASPYGESYAKNPAGAGALFAGLLGDTSSELNDASFREYNPLQGRWISPDPAGLAAVDVTNPQSLNRYAYVMNNPTTLTDPSGLKHCVGSWPCVSANFGNEPDPGGWMGSEGGILEFDNWGSVFTPGVNGEPGTWSPYLFTSYGFIGSSWLMDYGGAPSAATNASGALLKFLSSCEGFSGTAYVDSRGNCTIGYGHLLHMGSCTDDDDALSVTQQVAMDQFAADVSTAVTALNNNLTVPLTQSQFDAMVSLTFNMGMGRLQTHDAWGDVNAGNMGAVPGDIKSLGAGGPGMPTRRANEANMFQNGVYANACYSSN